MKRLACAIVLAGSAYAAGIAYAPAAHAQSGQARAQSGLLLNVLTPDPGSIGDTMPLDVTFKGGSIVSVELYLDNALVAKRQINTNQARGILSFSVDVALLAEGTHNVLVKATGADGKVITATGRVRIPSADLNAPIRIAYPQNGIQVSGTVPIKVSVDPEIQKLKPYVSIFVDKEFKILRNYPPYEYIWDTTRTPNGWHVIEALTQTQDQLSPTKARALHIQVNNASGETKKMEKVEDLRSPARTKPQSSDTKPAPRTIDPETAVKGTSKGVPNMVASAPGKTEFGTPRLEIGEAVRPVEPAAGSGISSRANGKLPQVQGNAAPPKMQGPAPRMMGGAVTEPNQRIAMASAPKSALPSLGSPNEVYPVLPPVRSNEPVKARPGETLTSLSARTGLSTREITRLNNLPVGTTKLRGGETLIMPVMGTFNVAYNGTAIHFDVPPRTENGIRLAPFRQIFEFGGGKLFWNNTEKSVKAVSELRNIELKIGEQNAKVNSQSLRLERAPYLDRGRTIVPLSFIRDSMNVKVHFDEKTGRLLIESSK